MNEEAKDFIERNFTPAIGEKVNELIAFYLSNFKDVTGVEVVRARREDELAIRIDNPGAPTDVAVTIRSRERGSKARVSFACQENSFSLAEVSTLFGPDTKIEPKYDGIHLVRIMLDELTDLKRPDVINFLNATRESFLKVGSRAGV